MFTNYFSADETLDFFEQAIFIATGQQTKVIDFEYTGGGCINNALQLNTGIGSCFIKWNEHQYEAMFACEAKGLETLRQHTAFKVPEVLGYGSVHGKDFILLETLHKSHETPAYWENMGRMLAEMHRNTYTHFGLDYDNYIGSLPQNNAWKSSGIQMLIENRLMPLAGRALYEYKLTTQEYKLFEILYQKLPSLIPDEPPALVHGDLWSGNIMPTRQNIPAIFDPAVHFGLREAELAFTKLFGGFDVVFYHAYQEHYPLEPGFDNRVDIYNLYPLLVHLILFGQGYKSAIIQTLKYYAA